jgi:hypothetical protein
MSFPRVKQKEQKKYLGLETSPCCFCCCCVLVVERRVVGLGHNNLKVTEVDMSGSLLRRRRVWTRHGDGGRVWTRQNVVEVVLVEMVVEARWWDRRCCLEINKN